MHKIIYSPPGKTLLDFHTSSKRVRFIIGPFGSGKTTSCLMEIYYRICNHPVNAQGVRQTRFAVVRSTYPQLETTTLNSWKQIFDQPSGVLGKLRMSHPPTHNMQFQLIDNTYVKSEIIFLAMDNDNDVNKLLSLELTGIYYNELSDLSRKTIHVGLGRIGRYNRLDSWYGIIGDTNGMPKDHWFYEIAEQNTPKQWQIFKQPSAIIKNNNNEWIVNKAADNITNLPPNYYQDQVSAFDEDEINVYLLANYGQIKSNNPVWPSFNERNHVMNIAPSPNLPIGIGADWGLTPAAVIGQIFPDGSCYILDEIVTENADAQELADMINAKCNTVYKNFVIDFACGDPSGIARSPLDRNNNIFTIMRNNNLPFIPAPTNNWYIRSTVIANQLRNVNSKKPGLLINSKCQNLILGMGGRYHYNKSTKMPEKNHYSHVCDALQYWALGANLHHNLTGKKTKAIQANYHFNITK